MPTEVKVKILYISLSLAQKIKLTCGCEQHAYRIQMQWTVFENHHKFELFNFAVFHQFLSN